MLSDVPEHGPDETTARQRRISEIVSAIIPRLSKNNSQVEKWCVGLGILSIGLACYLGGYLIGENMRHLNYSEKVILSSLVDHTASIQNVPRDKITERLCAQLKTTKIKYIRAYQWKEALTMLGQYID